MITLVLTKLYHCKSFKAQRVTAQNVSKHCPLFPFTYTGMYIRVRRSCLHILLNHTDAFALRIQFVYVPILISIYCLLGTVNYMLFRLCIDNN
jgi:hypothetical protein